MANCTHSDQGIVSTNTGMNHGKLAGLFIVIHSVYACT